MDKEQQTIKEKETVVIPPKTTSEIAKEHFITASMSAGMVLAVLLLLWVPFKLIPFMLGNGTNFVSTTLSSLFISGESTSTAPADNKSANNQTSSTANTSTTYSNVPARVYSGKPDLEISLISTGIIDPASKQFTPTNYVGFNDEIAIRFQVKNIGTNVSGAWKLRINAPSRTTPYYDSPDQTSIKPGDRIIFTTTFNSPVNTGVNTAYITADPLNMVSEISESNNELTVPININSQTYNYNNNYNYGSGVATNLPYGTMYTWSNVSLNCYASPQTAYIGSPVTWYASVSGGNGYYTYSWSGDSSYPMYSNQSSVSAVYYTSGTKIVSVTVNSNGTILTKQCSVYIY